MKAVKHVYKLIPEGKLGVESIYKSLGMTLKPENGDF